MQISKKNKVAILFGIPIVIGLYFIYKQFAKKGSSITPIGATPKQPTTLNKPTSSTSNDAFPLKKGSKDAGAPLNPNGRVVDLQRLINYLGYVPSGTNNYVKLVEDGIFGSKTEAALNFWIQQNSIQTQMDWNYLYNQIHPSTTIVTSDVIDNLYKVGDIGYYQSPQIIG